MSRSPIPGEASLDLAVASKIALVRNVTLGTLTSEQHLDAIIDTGATYCIVPLSIARALGFRSEDRIGAELTNTVGGQVSMDLHRMQYLKVGSAKAYSVVFGAYNAIPGARWMIVGLSFIGKFTTTVDFDENRVVFRPRAANR